MTLKKLIEEVVQELNISAGSLVVGGISAGGTDAVRYSECCISSHCDVRSKPVAIFSVDAPLDFESWWNREKLNLRRGSPKSGLEVMHEFDLVFPTSLREGQNHRAICLSKIKR